MSMESYTDRLRGFLQSAQGLALRMGHPQIMPEHLLKVLLDDGKGLAASLIAAAGADRNQALTLTDQAIGGFPKVQSSGRASLNM